MDRLRTRIIGIGVAALLAAPLPALSQQRPAAPSQSTTAPAAPSARAPASGTTQFDTEAAAKAHCPGATVVWTNLKSKIYHFSGHADYGHTKSGAYMCEKDADAVGFRAAKNEKHP